MSDVSGVGVAAGAGDELHATDKNARTMMNENLKSWFIGFNRGEAKARYAVALAIMDVY